MLQIDAWKRVLIVLTCVVGLLLALPNAFYTRVENHNDAAVAIELFGETPERAEALSRWPGFLPSGLVNLGLDLRGGAHLLAEVQVGDVYETRMKGMWPDIRNRLREARATVGTIRLQPGPADELRVKISQPENMAQAVSIVREIARPVTTLTAHPVLNGVDAQSGH